MKSIYFSLLTACILLTGCQSDEPTESTVNQRPAKILRVSDHTQHQSFHFVGQVASASTIDTGFEVAGRIAKLSVREGDVIAKGALLAELDTEEFQLAIAKAEAELNLANQELTRINALRAKDLISIAQQDSARTKVELLKLKLKDAQKNLSDASLFAPFDALIIKRHVDNYSNVGENQSVLRLAPSHQFEILTHVPEKLVATISEDQVEHISARFHFRPDKEWPLALSEYTAEASAQTQTFGVKLTLRQTPQWKLLPGMTADVTVQLQANDQSHPMIPVYALQSDANGNPFVWRWNADDGSIQSTPVTASTPIGDQVSILNGLETGDLIVGAGAHAIQPGMTVIALGGVPAP